MQVFVCLFLKQSDFTLWVIGKSRHVDRYRGHLMGVWRDMSMSFAMDIFFIIYICQYSELILLLTEKLFLYRLIYILTEYFDMKKE